MTDYVSAILIATILLTGCQSLGLKSNSPVNVVRNGVLEGYSETTVAKAFEGTFKNAKWTSFETPKGKTVVEFRGTVTYGALRANELDMAALFRDSVLYKACPAEMAQHDDALARNSQSRPELRAADSCAVPVRFQFTLSADKSAFTVSYVDQELFKRYELETVLKFIYG